jgi:hypothetical protein
MLLKHAGGDKRSIQVVRTEKDGHVESRQLSDQVLQFLLQDFFKLLYFIGVLVQQHQTVCESKVVVEQIRIRTHRQFNGQDLLPSGLGPSCLGKIGHIGQRSDHLQSRL